MEEYRADRGDVLARLIRGEYEVETTVKEGVVDVPATPITVLDNNPRRLSYLIANVGDTNIRVAFTTQGNLNPGVLLSPGASLSVVWDEDFELVGYGLFAVSEAGTGRLHYVVVEGQK